MSQQYRNDQEMDREEAKLYTGEYGESPRQRSLFNTYGEKVSTEKKDEYHLMRLRWALAVISLILWVVMFLISMGLLTTLATGHFYSGDDSGSLQTFIICGVVGFTALVLAVNIFFNRKH
jgi:hypothetical protein